MSNVTTIRPQWAVPAHVHVHATTRLGGVSKAPFDSLNVGLHVQDNPEHVQENRRRVQEALALPSNPVWLKQVHGDYIQVVRTAVSSNSEQPIEADGAYTQALDRVLVVLTADCLPIVLSNSSGNAVAVVHAGWRGLASGIVQTALAQFSDSSPVHAWLGPAIGPKAFEVGEEVRDAFVKRDAFHGIAFTRCAAGKYMADIYTLARTELNTQRQVTVSGGDHCTVSEASLFHSHRRDGVLSGRLATYAWLTSPEA